MVAEHGVTQWELNPEPLCYKSSFNKPYTNKPCANKRTMEEIYEKTRLKIVDKVKIVSICRNIYKH